MDNWTIDMYKEELGTKSTDNPLKEDNRIVVERMATHQIFDNIRDELRQIYQSTETRGINYDLRRENDELKNSEDTPYTMSLGNSRRNTWDRDRTISSDIDMKDNDSFKKYSYRDIEQSLVKFYKPAITKLDILMIFLNGQKHIYLQSHRITLLKLNLLYFPSMLLTSFTTFFAPFSYIGDIWWGNIALSVINAVILILIGLISYLKLESTSTIFFQLYSEYEKLNLNMEFFYNRLLEEKTENHNELVQKKNEEVESTVQNLKNYFSIVVPKEIQDLFPILSHVNIFAFIKKIEEERNLLIQEYYQAKNEIRYILHRQKDTRQIAEINRQNLRINHLLKKKEEIKNSLVEYKAAFSKMEEIVIQEIKYAEQNTHYLYLLSPCKNLFFITRPRYSKDNKIIDDYLAALL